MIKEHLSDLWCNLRALFRDLPDDIRDAWATLWIKFRLLGRRQRRVDRKDEQEMFVALGEESSTEEGD